MANEIDFDSMSDDELIAWKQSGGKPPAQSAAASEVDFDNMSDKDLFAWKAHGGRPPLPTVKPSKGIGDMALEGGLWALDKLDSVTGAPTRAALDASIDGKNPFSAFGKQFAEDTSLAPTGKTIAQKVGVSEDRKSVV